MLLPVAHGGYGHAQRGGELGLAELGLGADCFDVRPGRDAASAGIGLGEGDGVFKPGHDAFESLVVHAQRIASLETAAMPYGPRTFRRPCAGRGLDKLSAKRPRCVISRCWLDPCLRRGDGSVGRGAASQSSRSG